MDFTLSTWIMLTKKPAAAAAAGAGAGAGRGGAGAGAAFITGKVSHNDAWPVVSTKADGKVEVLFGHGAELERFTSQATLPLLVWVHIAVVVEPKKIKLFINGALDSQAVTKGNGRAILYPVVVGSCPPGVRTRVEQVREGFDGILAQYKYHTRALSPIHVKGK